MHEQDKQLEKAATTYVYRSPNTSGPDVYVTVDEKSWGTKYKSVTVEIQPLGISFTRNAEDAANFLAIASEYITQILNTVNSATSQKPSPRLPNDPLDT